QAAAWVLALAALDGVFNVGTMYSDVAQSLSSEPVYEATPELVNPALEGKLVKMRVTELVAEGGPVVDETFGLSKENAIALHRCFIHREKPKRRIQVNYNELHGIRESWILAPQVKAGGYSLRARESFWEDFGEELINTEALTLPTMWETVDRIVFQYRWIPSPWRGVRHIVGRQHGNALEGCGLIRGEQEYQQKSRIRTAIWEPQELLALLGGITLCLLPAVWMVQKQGCLRATYVSILFGVLLTALVASAFLLLPYAEHNWLTWLYTLVPGLIAFVLLCPTCRKRG
ncbi:MAG: hypothetical protein IJ956_03175, partial [Akkermansia sp.]|nr:hypothetical protein [Akkermansia sp.]